MHDVSNLLMLYVKTAASQKLLASWDFHVLQSAEFTENGQDNKEQEVQRNIAKLVKRSRSLQLLIGILKEKLLLIGHTH